MSAISEIPNQFSINGVLSTDDSVLSNMEKIAASCACFLTYDIHAGKWSVVINQAGDSVRSFTDSNIVGPVNVTSTGLQDLYNSVQVTYPRDDLNDEPDWVRVELLQANRNFQEPDQTLDMQLFMTNDPVQAELVGFIELKQNRVDKLVTFVTDYTAIDLNAGDIIDLTIATWQFVNKPFRILTMRESDGDSGELRIEITALEYDASVYDNDLNRYSRSTNDGIVAIGAIGTPAAPSVNVTARDARPHVVINAATPSGVVTGMEFWVSQTNASTGFQLYGVERPVGSATYATGTAVSAEVMNLSAGNIFSRVRGFNGDVEGPFSAVTTTAYAPVQVTNQVDSGTAITDINGNLLTVAAITTLMTNLDGLISNNASGGGSLFSQIFGLFNTVTGVNLVDDIGTIQSEAGAPVLTALQAGVGGAVLAASTFPDVIFAAGPNVTIVGDSATNVLTIDAVGGVTGNLVVGALGLSFSDDIELEGNILNNDGAGANVNSVVQLAVNTATNPPRVEFSTLVAPATLYGIGMGTVSVVNGPFPGPGILVNTGTFPAQALGGIYAVCYFEFSANLPSQPDPGKRVEMRLLVNNTVVAVTADSVKNIDSITDLTLGITFAQNIQPGSTVKLQFLIETVVAVGCECVFHIQQFGTGTNI